MLSRTTIVTKILMKPEQHEHQSRCEN